MSLIWQPHDYPLSYFLFDGKPSPGICQQPKGATVKRKLDERQGYGIDAAFVIYTGRELAEFECELLLVTKKHWIDWQTWRAVVHEVPARGPVQQSTDGYQPGRSHMIWHPQLTPLGITQCVVSEEPQEVIDEFMVGHVNLKFKQVSPVPKQAYAKPEAPKDKPPMNADEQEIKALTDRVASLRQRNAMAGK